jgi:hypothetical protein
MEGLAILGHSLLIWRFGENSMSSPALPQPAQINRRKENGSPIPQSFREAQLDREVNVIRAP